MKNWGKLASTINLSDRFAVYYINLDQPMLVCWRLYKKTG